MSSAISVMILAALATVENEGGSSSWLILAEKGYFRAWHVERNSGHLRHYTN